MNDQIDDHKWVARNINKLTKLMERLPKPRAGDVRASHDQREQMLALIHRTEQRHESP